MSMKNKKQPKKPKKDPKNPKPKEPIQFPPELLPPGRPVKPVPVGIRIEIKEADFIIDQQIKGKGPNTPERIAQLNKFAHQVVGMMIDNKIHKCKIYLFKKFKE